MRLFTIFTFIFLLSVNSWAGRCPNFATSNHLVVTLEGLGGELLGSQALQLARRANHSNYQIANYSHSHAAGIVGNCVERWKRSAGPNARITIIGHSLGGGAAVDLANNLQRRKISVEDMITFDGRYGNEGGCLIRGTFNPRLKLSKPYNVKNVRNYYQRNDICPGRLFLEGHGVQNIPMQSSHIGLPRQGRANSEVSQLLNNGMRPTDNGAFQVASSSHNPQPTGAFSGIQKFFDSFTGNGNGDSTNAEVASGDNGGEFQVASAVSKPQIMGKDYFKNHRKANWQAKCMIGNRWVTTTWARCSEESVQENLRGR